MLLALAPRASLASLAEEDLVLPVAEARGGQGSRVLAGAMAPESIVPSASRGGGLRFVPATISTPLVFYSRARVAEAVEGWQADRNRIDAALRQAGGSGLPQQYRLEADPDDWDTFDIAVLAAFWANRPYDGLRVPRVAHAAIGDAATVDLATRAFSQGASTANLLDLDAIELRDALAWESVFFAAGWYHPAMTKENWEQERAAVGGRAGTGVPRLARHAAPVPPARDRGAGARGLPQGSRRPGRRARPARRVPRPGAEPSRPRRRLAGRAVRHVVDDPAHDARRADWRPTS